MDPAQGEETAQIARRGPRTIPALLSFFQDQRGNAAKGRSVSTENLWEPDEHGTQQAEERPEGTHAAPASGNSGAAGTSRALAGASVVAGAISLPIAFWLNWIAGLVLAVCAIVLGAVALKRGARRALPTIGIVLGAACVIIFGVLVALLFNRVSQMASVLS